MKQSTKKKNILLLITSFVFLMLIFMASYAYFSGNIHLDLDQDIKVSLPDSTYVFTSSSTDNIVLNLSAIDMQKDKVDTEAIAIDDANISVSLSSSDDDTSTFCTYDLVWTFDSSADRYIPDTILPYTDDESNVYNYEMSLSVSGFANSEKDISNLENNIILKNETIESHSLISTSKTYNVIAKVYNLPINQENIKGKNFSGKVGVSNIRCVMSSVDNLILVFIETGVGTNVYNQTEIDPNKNYVINNSRTTCESASYDSVNHKVNVSTFPDNKCEVYLQRAS